MKLNFRKIASVLSSAVMVSSTVALAAAASYPAPFVSNGTADVAVVYGTSGTLDLAAATDIAASLNSKVTPGTSTTVTGESFKLARSSDSFNLGDRLNGANSYTSLDSAKLPTVLADGVYTSDAGDDFDYTQKITLGNAQLTHFLDQDFNDNKPIVGFKMTDGQEVLNYTLNFVDDVTGGDADFVDLENTEIKILGKTYYISGVEIASGAPALTLLDKANTISMKEGESQTVTSADGQSFEVTLTTVNDGGASDDKATFTIGGKTYSNLLPGSTRKLADNEYLSVSEITYSDKKDSSAQFSIGSGKIYIENGQEVQVNDEDVDNIDEYNSQKLIATVTNTTEKLQKIVLSWSIGGDNIYVAPGSDLVMPAFGAVKLSMLGFNVPDTEKITIDTASDASTIKLPTSDGDVTLYTVYGDGTNILGTGKSATHELVTNSTSSPVLLLNDTRNSYFVASWVSGDQVESHPLELSSIKNDSGTMKVKLVNLGSTGKDVEFNGITDTQDIGSLTMTLLDASETYKYAKVQISEPSGSATAYGDRIISKNGLTMLLPEKTLSNQTAGGLNLTTSPTSWRLTFYEQDRDNNVFVGTTNYGTFNVTIGEDSDGTTVSAITGVTTYDTEEDSDIEVGYAQTDKASKLTWSKPTSGVKTLELDYPEGESTADVVIAESGATTSAGTTGNIAPIFDTDAASLTGKNLIVVGGSCVNTMAAQLLGVPAGSCGTAWQTKTNVGAGQFLIQTFARGESNVATLVAGYNMEDTANAVKALKTDTTIDIAAGKKYVGTATSVQAVAVA